MIRCNLSSLLVERGLKITKVAEDTGLSRTTLTSLANNRSQGIQFDTLNTLCLYLQVSPDQLISFIPVNIDVVGMEIGDDIFTIALELTDGIRIAKCQLHGEIFAVGLFSGGAMVSLLITMRLICAEADTDFAVNAFNSLPLWVSKDFEGDILMRLHDHISGKYGMSVKISFDWEKRLTL